jgi:hypothetical protein
MIGVLENPYIPQVDKFKNSLEFRYLATIFEETGAYTALPPGTMEYRKFWEDVRYKCIYGYTNSLGIRITGHHFFYLNFCRMEKQNKKTKRKEEGFPEFSDLDYEYFHTIEYCKVNEKSYICVKGRRQGYSYKAAGICSHEFLFYPKSRCLIGAFLAEYSDGTMRMVLDNLNFINTHTEFRKQRNPNKPDHIVAKYEADIGGVKVWKGSHSEVKSITFKDRPHAAVGKSCAWLILDEAGIFPNITDTYGYTEPLIKDGSTYTGVSLIFGSSGDMDSGSKYFYEMYTNPRKYNLLEFRDPENGQKMIGYFSSALKGRWGVCTNPESKWYKQLMVDEDGNSNLEAAYDDIIFERARAKGGTDNKALHSKTTQFPLTWKEAFLRNKGTVFASIEMFDWLSKLETTASLHEDKKKVELYFDHNNKIKARLNPDLLDIMSYPYNKEKDGPKDGCVVIWEDPLANAPIGLYIAGIDPYDQDDAETSDSLGSIFIYKRFVTANQTHDVLVAEYTGRPEKSTDFYEICRKLLLYYNARALYENMLKGLKSYFEQKNSLYLLYEQPQIIKDFIKDSKVNRGYGIHMTQHIKAQCEIYLKDWLYSERTGGDGIKMLNLHTIKSIPLLKELIAYDREVNTDRVVALMCCILQTHELYNIQMSEFEPKTIVDMESFWTRQLFKKNTQHNNHRIR